MGMPQYQNSGVSPYFDPTPHLIRLILIRCGQLLYPEEKNISVLVEKVSEAIGLQPFQLAADHSFRVNSPQQRTMVVEAIKPKPCPKCGKETVRLFPICQTCDELSENRKYQTIWACKYPKVDAGGTPMFNQFGLPLLGDGCGYMEKSDKGTTQWLEELKIPYQNQTKRSLGIQTLTDKGVE